MNTQTRGDFSGEDALDERLMLGMNFAGQRLALSKFYAYRGLYLSGGFRVELANEFSLNEENVIVLPDCKFEPVRRTFTAFKTDEQNFWQYADREKKLSVNLFDGEGLICPAFAKHVSDALRQDYKFIGASHSFQVRLPFTKGVLHEVDFQKFFAEQLPTVSGELLVEDAFGVTRDLRKAKIILTKSMFKCTDWIKSADFKSDPMKFFFDRFAEYEHALYVVSTEARLRSEGQEALRANVAEP